jgi:hypothetical protein
MTTPSSTGTQSRSEQQAAAYQECARVASTEQTGRAANIPNANSRLPLPDMIASRGRVDGCDLQVACPSQPPPSRLGWREAGPRNDLVGSRPERMSSAGAHLHAAESCTERHRLCFVPLGASSGPEEVSDAGRLCSDRVPVRRLAASRLLSYQGLTSFFRKRSRPALKKLCLLHLRSSPSARAFALQISAASSRRSTIAPAV